MRLIVLTDIDDTLMQTQRKCVGVADLSVGALSKTGTPGSFMSGKQRRLWALLETQADIRIPVTARTSEALARVDLAFADGAVCDFGATVLAPGGRIDTGWQQHMQACSRRLRQGECFDALLDMLGFRRDHLKAERHVVGEVPVFATFRCAASEAQQDIRADVERLLGLWGVSDSYYLHCTDRDVTVLPRFVSKAAAVQHLAANGAWDNDLVLALGDSLSDAGFMSLADYFVIPSASRLATLVKETVAASREHA